jgi:hypothetical protein
VNIVSEVNRMNIKETYFSIKYVFIRDDVRVQKESTVCFPP